MIAGPQVRGQEDSCSSKQILRRNGQRLVESKDFKTYTGCDLEVEEPHTC